MKVLLVVALGIIGVIVLVVAVVILIGSSLPKTHTASRSLLLHQSPENVYAVAREFAAAPNWRSDVKQAVVENQPDGRVHFRESGKNGTINYELVEDVPGKKIVTRILDTNLGYSGKWTFVFGAEKGNTLVTITEDGEISNLLFRFMARYIFGYTSSLDSYLNSLARRFGETATPK